MTTLIPYLTLPGRCEEALHFYEKCFKGRIPFLQTYAQTDYAVSPAFKNKIAHAEFIAEGIHFYASDGLENDIAIIGSNIGLTLSFTHATEQRTVFETLKMGGIVTLPFNETSIGSTLATLIDQYGIHWYLNHEPS